MSILTSMRFDFVSHALRELADMITKKCEVQPWFSPSLVRVTVHRSPDMIFSTNPLRNQMSGSFTGSPPDLAVIGKHHLPIRNDTVRDMMLRFSDYLAVRRY